MAIDNYIDKITKDGESRMISPAADKVRVENEHYEGDNLDDVLDEIDEKVSQGGEADSAMSSTSERPVQNKVIKAYVDNLIADLIDGAPAALDTLKELATALGNNSDDIATIINTLSTKANASEVVKSISVNGGQAQTPTNGNVNLIVEAGAQGPKGDTGNVEITDAGELVTILVNDLTTGGAGNILSAEMGKRLALMSGSFAQAWARSRAIPSPFCFLWNETVDGESICKPIWHKRNSEFVDAVGAIVNVVAASVPNAPTITGATSGSTVPKNTQITITPESGSALYYSLDGGATFNVSDAAVTIKLETAGSVSIVAYCANNKGNSSNATLSVTVAGTAVPTFAAKPNSDTTLTQKSGYIEVSRGGYVRIFGTENGTLYYSTDGENYTEVQGNNYYDFQIADDDYETTAFVIYAKNRVGNEFSDPVTGAFKMAALTPPSFSVATGTEFPATGGSVELTGPVGATIYYTTNGNTPTDQSTQYTGAIAVTSATTIKAIAHDTYGDSVVAEASYTIKEDAIIIDTTDQSATVSIGGVTYNLDSDTPSPQDAIDGFSSTSYRNIITQSQLSGVQNDKKTIMSFSDKTKIRRLYTGGFHVLATKLLSGASSFRKGEVDIYTAVRPDNVAYRTFYNIGAQWSTVRLKVTGAVGEFNDTFSTEGNALYLDISELSPLSSSGFTNVTSLFGAKVKGLTIGAEFKVSSAATGTSSMFSSSTAMETLTVLSTTPPDVTSASVFNWLSALVTKSPNVAIKVPAGSLAAYTSASGWSDYANNISEIS